MKFKGSRVGAVVRALAFQQCVPAFDTRTRRRKWTEFVGSPTLLRELFLQVVRLSPLSKNQHLIWEQLQNISLKWLVGSSVTISDERTRKGYMARRLPGSAVVLLR